MENGSQKIGLRVAAGVLVAITIIVAVFASGITFPSQEVKTGGLTLLLTDAPVDLERLMITIDGLEVHRIGIEDSYDGGWISLMDEGTEIGPFNLLEYQDGEMLVLVDDMIPGGTFNKIRMHILEATAIYPVGNEPEEDELTVPPGKIDIICKFELTEGDRTTVIIDMEPDWIAIKNSKLRPVIKVILPKESATTSETESLDGGED